jgi:hypothetical protein
MNAVAEQSIITSEKTIFPTILVGVKHIYSRSNRSSKIHILLKDKNRAFLVQPPSLFAIFAIRTRLLYLPTIHLIPLCHYTYSKPNRFRVER